MSCCSLDISLTCAIFFIVLLLTYYLVGTERYKNLPPGPIPWPGFGNISQLHGKDLRLAFADYRKKYGNIFTVRLMNRIVIVVNGFEEVRDVLSKHGSACSGRPTVSNIGPQSVFKGQGIIFANGEIWKHNRRFILQTLRDFGMGKRKLQTKINEEISYLLDIIAGHQGRPFDMKQLLYVAVSNIICSIVFGRRYDYHDEELEEHMRRFDELTKTNSFLFPGWLKYIPGDPFGKSKNNNTCQQFVKFYKSKIREHRATYDQNKIRDVIDAYIKQSNEEYSTEKTPAKCDDELIRIVHDLFLAGSETTTVALNFGLLFLVRNRDIQERVHKELQEFIPNDKPITMEDKQNLTFAEAAISEILRRASILPHSVPHTTTMDIEFRGYTIPKSAIIMPSLQSVLTDELLWDAPHSFNPSRFLNGDNTCMKTKGLIPFSLGPRVCAGESLARMELFLFITSLIQRFEFLPETDCSLPSLDSEYGPISRPKSFKVRAIQRGKSL